MEQPATEPPSTPKRHKEPDLDRDDRLRCLTLRKVGLSYLAIAQQVGCTLRQVQTACNQDHPTPKKRKGRPGQLSKDDIDQLEFFICSSRTNRLLSYLQLSVGPFSHLEVSADIIKRALQSRGYRRYVARAKPPLSEKNRADRLKFAQDHLHWTIHNWSLILWTDKTWVTGGRHRKQYVTRKPGEELDPTCVLEKWRKKRGWMFWGSFHGFRKGPCLFWEKSWGSINQNSYREHILPILHKYLYRYPYLSVMQDNAAGHAAKATLLDMQQRGIPLFTWPAFSPDLNPIETIWNWMKDWIEWNYPDKVYTYPKLREIVKQAWDVVVTEERLKELLESMPARCQAVIDADGWHTKF